MDLRNTGIEAIGQAPWGTHFCQFYQGPQDLVDVLVPYLRAGLEADEFCMWVTSPPLEAADARAALARVVPDVDRYLDSGQLEILPHDAWYLRDGRFDRDRVLRAWVDKLEAALARGFAGLRLTGNTFWLEKADWESFARYEEAVDRVVGGRRILSLCTYSLERCGAAEIADVIKNHEFALLKRDGAWDLIESFHRHRLEEEHRQELARERQRRLEREMRRFELLAGTAGDLLHTRQPDRAIEALCSRVMEYLGCQVFLNYLADAATGRLRLHVAAGLTDRETRDLEWLDGGEGLCGSAARDGEAVFAEHILDSVDPRAERARSFGARVFACLPLVGPGGRTIGTLAFGSGTRDTFDEDDRSLLQAVADQVSVALVRIRDEEALREADRRKNEFLAVLSHELRNPLAPMVNGLRILDRAPPSSDQALRARTVIRRQVEHLSRLVDDLLDVTRVSRNKISLQLETIELGELVRRAVEDQRSLFERGRIELDLSLAADPLHVQVDPVRIAQVVGNLLQNAAKFVPPGGSTRVAVGRAPENTAEIVVTDDGLGMRPETLAHVFEPFVQADQTLDRGKGGLGLGLALVKGLVELHGGEIRAYSDGPGRGARFVVRLPLAEAPASPAPADATGARTCSRRVLIVEDNPDAADSLRDVLDLAGHEVEVARDGPSGLARAREFRPEVVLCDLGLPGLDGYGVARALRADSDLSGTFLVALSGYALPEDRRRSAEAGFDCHLAKPPDLDRLERLLVELRDFHENA